ncbi:MAG: hypothetical protein R8G33_00995 [Gammaproteobacteria bacterium]|nr:hypothetical protein [Gammaproteobacteria bacterium]
MEILILTVLMAIPLIGLCSLPLIADSANLQNAVSIRNRVKRY